MIKCALKGSHAHRTSIGYPDYQRLFSQSLCFVESIVAADVVILAWIKGFAEIAEEYLAAKIVKPDLQLVVISEEPFWDTLWGGEFYCRDNQIEYQGQFVAYTALNHLASNIFHFEQIPYFITTATPYFARYKVLFERNAVVTPE